MAQQNVGFVGVGRMGGPMCRRLIEAGNSLTIFDKSDAAMRPLEALGAKRVDSPAAVASAAEIVLASLPTPPIVQAAALGPQGVIEGSRVKIFIDVSTTGSTYAKRVAEGLKAKNIVAVDAPVSGGVAGAEKGTLAVMVSCDDETFATVKPVVEVIGKLFHVGKQPGQGQTMKLLNNLLSATAMAISSEAVVMGVKAGLDPAVMIDVINSGSGMNTASRDKFPRSVLPRTFDFGFATGLMVKDVRLALEEMKQLGLSMEVADAVGRLWETVISAEGAESDFTAAIKPIEKKAGVIVGGKRGGLAGK